MKALRERNKNQHDVHLEVIKSYNRLMESSERYKIICNHQQVKLDKFRSHTSDNSTYSVQPSSDLSEIDYLKDQLKTSSTELLTGYRDQQQLSRQVEELKNTVKNKQAEVVALKEALKKADEMQATLKKKQEQQEQNMAELETVNQCIKDEHTALQMAYVSLESRFKGLDTQNTQLIKEVVDNKQKIAEFLDKEVEDDNQKRLRKNKVIADLAVEGFVSIEVPNDKVRTPASSCLLPTRPMHSFPAHDGEVTCVSWNSNGRMFATGGADRKVRVWEVMNGTVESRFELAGNNAGVTNVSFEYDGTLLLASSNDFACRVWSINDQRLRSTLTGHGGCVLSAKFMMDANKVVSGGKDRVVKLWDLRNIACIKSLFIGSMCIDLVVVNSSTFVSGHFDNSVRFWDARSDSSKEHNLLPLTGKVCSLDISSDGRYILANTRDQVVSIIDTRMTASVVHNFQEEGFHNTCEYNKAVFSPDGNYIAVGSNEEEIYVWNIATQKLQSKIKSSDLAYAVSWSPNGGDFVSCGKHKSVVLWS